MGIFKDFSKDLGSRRSREITPASNVEDVRNASTLEAVNSCVMVADENNIIVSVNPAAMQMFVNAEEDIQRDLPAFSVTALIGSSIDAFHKNPAHQQSMMAELKQTHKAQISVGGRAFALTANPIYDAFSTRLGTVVEWEDLTDKLEQERLLEEKNAKEKVLAASNSRIKSALDVVSSKVMMADENNQIIYANDAVLDMLRDAESDLREQLPNFSADKIVGSNIDVFHKNPHHQASLLTSLRGRFESQIKIGRRSYLLIANPVHDENGMRLGTVVEWNDRLTEVAFEEAVDGVISAAAEGDLSGRIELDNTAGEFIHKISNGINRLLETFENVIEDAEESLGALAEGRLTRKIESNYGGSFGRLKIDINTSIERLLTVVNDIAESSSSVKEAAVEISKGNTNLSERTEEQAASLEETSSAMDQITSTVQQNAENSVQANTLARGAREAAENGGSVVGRAIDAMEAISSSSAKITDIIGVIDEIAFQTNLLALNAAVEAARAGDQGRGFAVVADEVRNLAGRSAKAAKEIKELIKDSSAKVNEGADLVNRSGETLEEIVTAVKKVNDIVAEIATASDEQSTGLDEINKSIGEMDQMTQQNAALVEEAAAASESMSDQADNLDRLISFFDTGKPRQQALAPVQQQSKPVVPSRQETRPSKPLVARSVSSTSSAVPKPEIISEDEGDEWETF
ncbi:MAG: methyl-accepting chemotaxis protein [Gammaproteobacteria bacterium]